MAPLVNFCRSIESTRAAALAFDLSLDDLLALGYVSLSAAATAIASATIEMHVPVLSEVVPGVLTVTQEATQLAITVLFWPPVSLTDTVQNHAHYVVFEPGSVTSEDLICEGRWIVEARQTAD